MIRACVYYLMGHLAPENEDVFALKRRIGRRGESKHSKKKEGRKERKDSSRKPNPYLSSFVRRYQTLSPSLSSSSLLEENTKMKPMSGETLVYFGRLCTCCCLRPTSVCLLLFRRRCALFLLSLCLLATGFEANVWFKVGRTSLVGSSSPLYFFSIFGDRRACDPAFIPRLKKWI